jgi:hypothetical protein
MKSRRSGPRYGRSSAPLRGLASSGSRTRDDLRGGDIDLFVEVEPGQASMANEQRLRDRIASEDLRTDVLLHERGGVLTLARIALRDGVPL